MVKLFRNQSMSGESSDVEITPDAALWVSARLTEAALREKPLNQEKVRLAAAIANADDPLAAAQEYGDRFGDG